MELEGKRVLVTGASSGIGADLCRELGGSGARLVLAARRRPELEALAQEAERSGARAAVVVVDLGSPGGADELARAAALPFGGIDVLINNAGIELAGSFLGDAMPDQGDLLLQVNLASPLRLASRLVGPMVERGDGAVVFVSSISAWAPFPNGAYYAASKAALARAAESIRIELKGTGVHVLAVYPGPIRTPMLDKFLSSEAKAAYRGLPQGTSTELARRIVDGLRQDEQTVVYPGVYRATTWFMGISRWVMGVTAPSRRGRP